MTQLTTAIAASILRDHGADVREGPAAAIKGGSADSRSTQPGDLFAAFPGENVDGNAFVDDALRAGAAAAICNQAPTGDWPDRTIAVVPDTIAAMAGLSRTWRESCPARVVGITGTVGKTTAKEFTADLLASRFNTHRSHGNLNSREGLPLALMSLRRDHEVSVLELAMDSRGEIAELCEIARPEVGVVLNVGLTHVSKLGSIEAIREEKLSLARWLPPSGTAILNADDPLVAPEATRLDCRVITFGQSAGARLRVSNVLDHGIDGVEFSIGCGDTPVRVHSTLPGAHTIPAAAAAIASAVALGMRLDNAAAAASAIRSSGRMRIVHTPGGVTLIDDRYNSSPASLAGALRMLATAKGRRIALLGRMAELGDFEAAEHQRAGEIAAGSCDLLAAVGEQCRELVAAAQSAGLAESRWFEDKEEAAEFIRSRLREGDTLLVKASRSQAFETILPALEASP